MSILSANNHAHRLQFECLEARQMLSGATPDVSAYEQLLIELVNRARANPTAEAARFGIGLNDGIGSNTISSDSKQPLAPQQALVTTAQLYSDDMFQRDYFSHQSPEGSWPWDRTAAQGYPSGSTLR